MIDHIHVNTGITAGGAGVSTANQTSAAKITGILLGFFLRFNDTVPATADVTIEAVGSVLPDRTILTLTNTNTDGFYEVELGAINQSGVAITNSFVPYLLLDDKIKVTIAQANDGDSLDLWAIVER